jgi:hypothetical protein
LIHKIGIKQLPEEIKSSLMQVVIVPKDFTSLGVQLQYFVGAVVIFFGSESIAVFEMRRLLLQFIAHFLFAIAKCFQHWFNECKQAQILRANVNNRIMISPMSSSWF